MIEIRKILVIHLLVFGTVFCLQTEDKDKKARIDLGDIANELFSRSETSSQVLSLNLTNLVILLVLKGLLFGVTYFGAGHHYGGGYGGGHHYKGRALDNNDEPLLSEAEILLLTSYLLGDAAKDYSCLYRVACQEPKKSKQYVNAAKLLLKGSKIFSDDLGDNNKYDELVRDLQDAIEFGNKYGSCEQKYNCNSKPEGNEMR